MKNKISTSIIILICVLVTLRDYVQAINKNISPVISIIAYILIFLAFLYDVFLLRNQKIEKTTLKYIVVLSCCFLLHFEAYTLLLLFMFVYVIRDYDYKTLIDFFYFPRLFFSIVLVVAFYCDLTPDKVIDTSYKGITLAHNFGITGNPNNASFVFFSLEVLMFLRGCLRNKKAELFFPLIISFWNYLMTGSRTFFVSLLLLYLIYLVIHDRRIYRLLLIIPIIAIFITIAIAIWERNNKVLNDLMSGRPWRWHDWFIGLKKSQLCFGPGMESTKKITIDNSYFEILIYGGFILLFIMCKDYLRVFYRRKTNLELCHWSLLYILVFAGLMESLMFSQIRDIVILNYLFLYNLLRERKKKKSYMFHYHGVNKCILP